MSIKNGIQAHYNHELDVWIVDVPFGLNARALEGVKSYLVKRWTAEVAIMSLGDKRDRCMKGLEAAKAGRIQQRMTHKGDLDFFKSTERENPTRAFSFPSLVNTGTIALASTSKE